MVYVLQGDPWSREKHFVSIKFGSSANQLTGQHKYQPTFWRNMREGFSTTTLRSTLCKGVCVTQGLGTPASRREALQTRGSNDAGVGRALQTTLSAAAPGGGHARIRRLLAPPPSPAPAPAGGAGGGRRSGWMWNCRWFCAFRSEIRVRAPRRILFSRSSAAAQTGRTPAT